jgi:hypothetical protein
MARPTPVSFETAEILAIQALGFLAQDPERLGRFLELTGLGPGDIRAAAGEPHFLAAVLDHIAGYEPLLNDFVAETGVDPLSIAPARAALGSKDWEREVP